MRHDNPNVQFTSGLIKKQIERPVLAVFSRSSNEWAASPAAAQFSFNHTANKCLLSGVNYPVQYI
jgi:hypothetical protein